ncbi:MAG: DUF1488 domain-containing protein [Aliivibrio sp.]|nr:DUF1488 domain-containing protein [Aliivibrio sp.]
MNQHILFPDIQQWINDGVNFPVQQSGQLIECWVSKEWLEKEAGHTITSNKEGLSTFDSLRFDIEEIIEERIEDECFTELGHVELK